MEKVKESTNGTLTTTDARAILEAEEKARVERCRIRVQQVLDEEKCTIDVAVLLRANQVIPQVQIVSK